MGALRTAAGRLGAVVVALALLAVAADAALLTLGVGVGPLALLRRPAPPAWVTVAGADGFATGLSVGWRGDRLCARGDHTGRLAERCTPAASAGARVGVLGPLLAVAPAPDGPWYAVGSVAAGITRVEVDDSTGVPASAHLLDGRGWPRRAFVGSVSRGQRLSAVRAWSQGHLRATLPSAAIMQLSPAATTA